MTRSLLSLLLLSVLCSPSYSQQIHDVIYRKGSSPLIGRILEANDTAFKVEVALLEGQPPALIYIPREHVERIIFPTDDKIDAFLKTATAAQLGEVSYIWKEKLPFLSVPNSNSGNAGLALAEILLNSNSPAQKQTALSMFKMLEEKDWNAERRATAKQGRLRAMLALGQASEAVAEAKQVAATSEDPGVLIEAKYVLAEASFQKLRKLLEENPRWEEDVNVRPERNLLYHETLDLYLFPLLFHGAEQAQAARGLWKTVEVYTLCGEVDRALEAAKDITILYPATAEFSKAKDFLSQHPEPKAN